MTDVGIEALKLYTVPEVARMLHLGDSTVWAMVHTGELGSIKVGASRRVSPEQIVQWKRSKGAVPEAEQQEEGEQYELTEAS